MVYLTGHSLYNVRPRPIWKPTEVAVFKTLLWGTFSKTLNFVFEPKTAGYVLTEALGPVYMEVGDSR